MGHVSEKDVLKCNIDAGRGVKTLPVFKLVAFHGVGVQTAGHVNRARGKVTLVEMNIRKTRCNVMDNVL